MMINRTGLEINNEFFMNIKNAISYIEYMNSRKLTGLEQQELQECLEGLKKGGFSNVVKALGF